MNGENTSRVAVALGGRSYEICIGAGLLERLDRLVAPLEPSSIVVVSDARVASLYGEKVRSVLESVTRTQLFALETNEGGKDLQTAARVLDALVAARADRKSVVAALGGGVVGDIAGFAAAVFMRGIRFVQVPTTLLAQVDSSVGGKTGVNHPSGKNLIGAFHQPSLVASDTSTLTTLPAREVAAGLAEILKHGLVADADYFAQVEGDIDRLLRLDPAALDPVIARSCEIKSAIVARDERESGERALLNLGHTFGHAIESLAGFGAWLHGEAVGCGLCLAADLSARLGLLSRADVARIENAVASARLPTRIEGLSRPAAVNAMRGDKKSEAGDIRFVILERIGRARQTTVPQNLLDATLVAGGYAG